MPQTEDYAICVGSDGRRGRAGSSDLYTNVSNSSKGNTETSWPRKWFLCKHSHLPSFSPVGKSLLKVLLYIYMCCMYTFTHRYVYLCVTERNDYANAILFPASCRQGYSQPPIHNLWHIQVQPCFVHPKHKGAVGLPRPRALSSAEGWPRRCCWMSFLIHALGMFGSLARWDQHPSSSNPLYHFSSNFVLWLRHRRRSIKAV